MSVAPSIPVAGATSDTRKDRERRYAKGYEDYVRECAEAGIEAISWMNWQYNEKLKDRVKDKEKEKKEREDRGRGNG